MNNLEGHEMYIISEVLECLRYLKHLPEFTKELQKNNDLINELIEIVFDIKENTDK
jgi:hypothetical protein